MVEGVTADEVGLELSEVRTNVLIESSAPYTLHPVPYTLLNYGLGLCAGLRVYGRGRGGEFTGVPRS